MSALHLFADAPEEIGPVTNVQGSLARGESARPEPKRIVKNVLIAMAVGWALIWIPFRLGFGWYLLGLVQRYVAIPPWDLPYAAALLLGGTAFYFTRNDHALSYVGRDGVAYFTFRNSPNRIAREVFRFQDAAELRTGLTRHFVNGRYTGDTYFFRWTNGDGKKIFEIASGRHPAARGHDWFKLGMDAELAWSLHLFERSKEELAKTGKLVFHVNARDSIAISPGALELNFGGKSARCERHEIDFVTVKQGQFTIKRKDARIGWFQSDGIFQFPYSTMPNARLFLFALEKLGGIPLTQT